MARVWEKRTTGWGTTEYVTVVDGVRYYAKKTGGRFISWEVREDKLGGARITCGSTLRSVKETFEGALARHLAKVAV